MPMYYMFDHEQLDRIYNKDGLSVFSSIYADGQISAPIYDYSNNKFRVDYNIHKGSDKVKKASKFFESKGSAIEFYHKQFRTYQMEWTLMFYDEFKPRTRITKEKPYDANKDVSDVLSVIQNIQSNRCTQKRVLHR